MMANCKVREAQKIVDMINSGADQDKINEAAQNFYLCTGEYWEDYIF